MSRTDAEVQKESREVRARLETGAARGGDRLVSFAERYAQTPKLRHSALILKLNHQRAGDDAGRADLKREMLTLLDQIVRDHEQRAHSPEAEAYEEAYTRLRRRLLKKPLPDAAVFECEGLAKRYPGSEFELTGVDLSLRLGNITAVVGQNAHGKTTLLRLVAGELRPDEGTLRFPYLGAAGGDVDWVEVKKEIAYLPQDLPRWYGSLQDNLHYEAALHGILGDDNEREVAFIVERLGLREHLEKAWPELSGGYKLRFALARVLVWKPKLLIMDEPMAHLDVKAQTVLLQDVRNLAQSLRYPMAVLMSSQHLHELEAVSTDIVFLRNGAIVYNGPVADIGEDRAYNAYELGTPLDTTELRRRLSDPCFRDVHYNGVSYVIHTDRETDHRAVLEHLLRQDVDVEYFRDISRSTKRLFE